MLKALEVMEKEGIYLLLFVSEKESKQH